MIWFKLLPDGFGFFIECGMDILPLFRYLAIPLVLVLVRLAEDHSPDASQPWARISPPPPLSIINSWWHFPAISQCGPVLGVWVCPDSSAELIWEQCIAPTPATPSHVTSLSEAPAVNPLTQFLPPNQSHTGRWLQHSVSMFYSLKFDLFISCYLFILDCRFFC